MMNLRERFTFLWSLKLRDEKPVRIHYWVGQAGACRLFQLEQVEELEWN